MLIAKDILKKASAQYEEKRGYPIQSEQIKALADSLVDAINSELHTMKLRIMSLEKELLLSDR